MARRAPLLTRTLAISLAAVAMLLGVVVAVPFLLDWRAGPDHPPVTRMASPGDPIPAEALAFRIRPGDVSVPLDAEPREGARPRTMEVYRSLRAYPGAPPRIPHEVSPEQSRANLCNACHAGGGYVPRFGAYTPVTPHPEFSDCLQCHVPDAGAVGAGPAAVPTDLSAVGWAPTDWVPREWPELDQRAMPGSPLWIPHELRLRENCVACHAGPSAVEELRTTHPDRTDCRSCHVPLVTEEPAFTRPLARTTRGDS
jgi:nitrate reductase (cytochrome), electron transfer subunit